MVQATSSSFRFFRSVVKHSASRPLKAYCAPHNKRTTDMVGVCLLLGFPEGRQRPKGPFQLLRSTGPTQQWLIPVLRAAREETAEELGSRGL